MLRTIFLGCKIGAEIAKNMKKRRKSTEKRIEISKSDQEMIDELDYEYKKAHKPYDKWERHWDEA